MDNNTADITYIERVMKTSTISKAYLSINCGEDFHFIGAIFLDNKMLFSVQSTELEKILYKLNNKCFKLLEESDNE